MKIINDTALQPFRERGSCNICNKSFPARDPHHVESKGIGGGKQLDIACNLLSLCRPCHARIDNRDGKRLCMSLLATRERVSVDVIEAVHRFILGLDKDASPFKLEEALMKLPASEQRIARRDLAASGKI